MTDDTSMPEIGTEAERSEIQGRIEEIHSTLSGMRYLSSGNLQKRYKRCGNPNCRCAKDPDARHGPYFEWSYMKGGKLRHRSLTAQQADAMTVAIENFHKVKRLLKTWEQQTLQLIGVSPSK